MPDTPEESIGAVPEEAGSEARTPERESIINPERAKVTGALDEAMKLMSDARDAGTLDDEQKRKLEDTAYAKTQTLDAGKTYFTHEPVVSETTGKKYRYQERIPTDGLLTFLDAKIREESTKPPSKRNSELLDQYRSISQTLAEHSRSLAASQRDPDRLVERVRLEAQLISRSDRDTGDPVQNWLLAEKAISTRLHLFIPRETKEADEPAVPGPGDPDFIGPVLPERTPEPGDPDFIGPVMPPSPGEPGFIGPTLPPEPGEPGFIGPVLPPSEGPPAPEHPIEDESEESTSEGREESDEDGEASTPPSIEDIRNMRFLIQVGAQGASAHKTVENEVRQEITNREAIVDKDGKPLDLGNKALVRAWNVLKYRLSRRGFKQGLDGLMREKTRYQLGQEAMQNLQKANLGKEIAGNAATHLNELRENGKEMLDRTRAYTETGEAPIEGEEVSGTIEGPFRDFITETLLYGENGILAKIRAGDDEATVQAEIQQKMFDYVSTHQDDETITHFFGQNDSRYGEVSKFYATDLLETAKSINEQARIHELTAEMLKDQIDIRLVRAQQEKASEIDYTTFEKLMVLSQKNRVASWVLTPTRAGVIAALATSGAQSAVRRTAMIGAGAVLSPWAVPVTGIAVGVAFAVGRERQRYKADTLDVARDSAEGKVAPENAVFRKKIENVVHPLMVNIDVLRKGDPTGESGDKLTGEPRLSIDQLLELPLSSTLSEDASEEERLEEELRISKNKEKVASRYGEIRARLSAPAVAPHSSVFAEIDRIQFSNGQKPEAGRTLLVQDLIKLREAALRGLSDEKRTEMEEFLASKSADWATQLTKDKNTQEHEFKRARLKRAFGQGAKMGIIGGASGLLGQELFAVAARYVPGTEGLPGFNRGQTLMEKPLGIHETQEQTTTPTSNGSESRSASSGRDLATEARNSYRVESGSIDDETQQQERVTHVDDFVNKTEELAGKVVDTLENATGSVKDTAEDTIEDVSERTGKLRDKIVNTADKSSEKLTDTTAGIRSQAVDSITSAKSDAENFVDRTIGDTRSATSDQIETAQRGLNNATSIGEGFTNSVRDELADKSESLENSVRDTARDVKDKTLESVDTASDSAKNVADELNNKREDVVESLKSGTGTVQKSGEGITHAAQQSLQVATESTRDFAGTTADTVTTTTSAVKEGAGSAFESAKDFASNAVDTVTDTASSIKDKASDILESNNNSGEYKKVNENTTETMKYWKPLNAEDSTVPDIEKFKDLGENGSGTVKLNEQYTLSYDAQKGTSIINSETNIPVFSSEDIKITPEGKVQIVGELPENAEKLFQDLDFKVNDIDVANSPIEHTVFGPDVKMVEAAMGTGPDAPLTRIPEGTVWVDGKDGAHTLLVADRPDIVLVADAKIVDGEFIYDKEYSYPGYDPRIGERTDGLFSGVQISNEEVGDGGHWVEIPTQGPDGKFENLKTDNTWSHRTNGTITPDGAELEMYTVRPEDKPNTMIIKSGLTDTLSFDSNGENPIDVQEEIKKHRIGFAFTMNPGTANEYSVIMPDGADGSWDGDFLLDPESTHIMTKEDGTQFTTPDGKPLTLGEFSRMVLDSEKLNSIPETGFIETEWDKLNEGGDRYKIWKTDLINMGIATPKADGTGYQFDSIQSITGSGEMGPEKVWVEDTTHIPTIKVGPLTEKLPVTEITPPTVPPTPPLSGPETVTTYNLETKIDEPPPPIIPIPFAPRETLEPIIEPEGPIIPPGYEGQYYGGASLEGAQSWLESRPQSHKPYSRVQLSDGSYKWVDKDGKDIIRSVDRERNQIQEFLAELRSADPTHYATLEKLLNEWQNDKRKLMPMSSSTRVSVNIPAWMEGKGIYNVLKQYTQQVDKDGNLLDPNTYEINIIVNRKSGSDPDNSVDEIERFIADSGNKFQINYIDVEFNPPFNTVGNARRVLTNLTLMRSLARATQTGQLYIESEDADLDYVDPRTVTNIIQKLDENPYLDAVRGIQDRNPDKMMANDYVFLYRRMQDFKEMIIRRQAYRPDPLNGNINPNFKFSWNRVITGGWNSAYTAEAYALIGGYPGSESMGDDPNVVPWSKGEDMVIGERLSMARGNGNMPNTQVIGKVATRNDSSPRRYIYEAASGKAAYGPDFEDEGVNEKIRNMTPEELMIEVKKWERIDTSNQDDFEQMLNSEYAFIRTTTPNIQEAQKVARMALLWLGFKRDYDNPENDDYEFYDDINDRGETENKLRIKNIANVKAALEDYRNRHPVSRRAGERASHDNRPSTP